MHVLVGGWVQVSVVVQAWATSFKGILPRRDCATGKAPTLWAFALQRVRCLGQQFREGRSRRLLG